MYRDSPCIPKLQNKPILFVTTFTTSLLRMGFCNIKFEYFELERVHLEPPTFCPLGNLSPSSLRLIRECSSEMKVVLLALEERQAIGKKEGDCGSESH